MPSLASGVVLQRVNRLRTNRTLAVGGRYHNAPARFGAPDFEGDLFVLTGTKEPARYMQDDTALMRTSKCTRDGIHKDVSSGTAHVSELGTLLEELCLCASGPLGFTIRISKLQGIAELVSSG